MQNDDKLNELIGYQDYLKKVNNPNQTDARLSGLIGYDAYQRKQTENNPVQSHAMAVNKERQAANAYARIRAGKMAAGDHKHSASAKVAPGAWAANRGSEEAQTKRLLDEAENTVFYDDFGGQFSANYTLGELTVETNLAWNKYLEQPTYKNRQRAQELDQALQQFTANNQDALDDEGVRAGWISKSMAGYLPQLKGRLAYGVSGAVSAAPVGAAAGSVIPGVGTAVGAAWAAKAGIAASQGKYSYQSMRGAAYRNMLQLGADEETALAAANDEAVLSAMIEMADTGIDIATLGIGSVLKSVFKAGAKEASKSAGKKLISTLARYGVNIGAEAGQELIQEGVTISNEKRLQNENTDGGIGRLVSGTASTIGRAFTGEGAENLENRDRMITSAKEGAKIAAMLGGGTIMATEVANAANAAKQGVIHSGSLYQQIKEKMLQAGYSEDAAARVLEGARIEPEAASQEEVNTYVVDSISKSRFVENPVISNDNKPNLHIGIINEKTANEIQNEYGINLHGYQHILNDNDLRHIYNRHGPHTNEKYPVTIDDLQAIPFIIENADNIYFAEKDNEKAGIYYKYRHNGVTYYLEQIIDEDKTLHNKQMIKVGAGEVPDIPELKRAIANKRSVSPAPDKAANAVPRMYVQDVRDDASLTPTVPQSASDVNSSMLGNGFGAGRPDDTGGNQERRFITNAMTKDAKQGSAGMQETRDIAFEQSGSNRRTVGFGESLELANQYIEQNGGADVVYDAFMGSETESMSSTDDAVIIALLRKYSQDGNHSRAGALAAKYAQLVSDQARALNMQKLLLRLSPEGALIQAERIINTANKKNDTKYTLTEQDRANILALGQAMQDKAIPDTSKLSPDMQQWFAKLKEKTDAGEIDFQDAVTAKYTVIVSNRLPSSVRQKFRSLQRIRMLANFRTQLRNIAGNLTLAAGETAAQPFTKAADKLLSLMTGQNTATISLSGVATGAKNEFGKALAEKQLGIDTVRNNRGKDSSDLGIVGKTWNPDMVNGKPVKALYKVLNSADELVGTMLRLGDAPFFGAYYQNTLNQMVQAQRLTEPTPEIIQAAIESALRRTFQDDNLLTKKLEELRNTGWLFGDTIAPYVKTPTNVVKVTAEYSPAGLTEALIKTFAGENSLRALQARGENTLGMQRQIAELFGRGMVGSGMILLGIMLPFLAGDDSEEERDAKDRLWLSTKGGMENSIRIGDVYFDVSPLQTITSAYLVGASASKGNFDWAKALTIASHIGSGALEMPVLQGVRDIVTGAYETDDIALGILGLLLEGGTQTIPFASLAGQISSAADPYVRTTVSGKKGVAKVLEENLVNPLKMLTPVGRKSLPIKYDTLGNPIQNTASSNGFSKFFNAAINPLNTSRAQETLVTKEIDRLIEARGGSSILPTNAPATIGDNNIDYRLSIEEKQEWQKVQGQTFNQIMTDLLERDEYQEADDSVKTEMLTKAADMAYDTAKGEFLEGRGAEYEGTVERFDALKNQGVPYAVSVIYYVKLKNCKTEAEKHRLLFEATDINKETKTKLDNVLVGLTRNIGVERSEIDFTDEESFVISQMSNKGQRNWQTFKEAGYTPEQYVQIYEIAATNSMKKDEKIEYFMGKYNWTYGEAAAVYKAANASK